MKNFTIVLLLLFAGIGVAAAQSIDVSGIMVDESGKPVAGVTVLVKGTTIGIATNVSNHSEMPQK